LWKNTVGICAASTKDSMSIVCVDLGRAVLISSGVRTTYWSFSTSKPLTISSRCIASPVALLTWRLPTGAMVCLSSRLNFMRFSAVAECRVTGMWTRPKLMAPFHRVRELVGAGMGFPGAAQPP
jgi:hypothetical protein